MDFKTLYEKYIEFKNLLIQIVNSKPITIENQKFITQFYNQLNDKALIEKIIMNLSFQKTDFIFHLKLFDKLVKETNIIYQDNINCLNEIDFIKIIENFVKSKFLFLDFEEKKLKDLSKIAEEVQEVVRHRDTNIEDENERDRVYNDFIRKRTEYKNQSLKYNQLYNDKIELKIELYEYRKNVFENINNLNEYYKKYLFDNFFNNDVEIYVDEESSKKLFNFLEQNEVFEKISEKKFYNSINFLNDMSDLKVRNNSDIYACFLISVLYYNWKNKNWKNKMLNNLCLTKTFISHSNTVRTLKDTGNVRAIQFFEELEEIYKIKPLKDSQK